MTDDERSHNREICILLLEDSEIDAELLGAHLTKAGIQFRLRRAINRRDFVAALEDGACDIILADYSLPDFDGLSALNIARALQPETPFIFVSGVVGEEFATNALKRGAADYVMKRNLTRLSTAVDRALEQARERRERRQAEAALHRSEIRARMAVEGADMGLWDFDPRTGLLEWDDRCRAMFDTPFGAPVDYEHFLKALHPDDRDRTDAAVKDALTWDPERPGGEFEHDFRVVGRAGIERWIASHGRAEFENGVCLRFLGVVRDITEERAAAEALRALTVDLEQQVTERTAERDRLWRLSRDLFAVVGFDGRFRRVNPAWKSVLGYDPDSLVGSKLSLLVHSEHASDSRRMMERLSRGQVIDRFEELIRHADGGFRWISWTAAPEDEAFYAVGRDITDEKAAAQAIAERNRELAAEIEGRERVEATLRQMQRLEAVGQLTSGVAHDFNNLLTVILGNIDVVERTLVAKKIDGAIAKRIGHMRVAAERGAKLTAQMLAFSRRQKLEPKPVDLNETVAGMRELLQSTMGGSVRIETILKDGLWPALVDPTQIELIILNLAINARDAMEVGGALTVETSTATLGRGPRRPEEPGPGDYVVLTVSDTGPGMAPDVLAKAFEPFFTTKEVGKGSGLGLAQVYGFAKQSGGGVRIDTQSGEGVSVKVFLPRAAVAAAEKAPATRMTAPVRIEPGRTVLLCDDDSAVREITGAMLQEMGYAVIEAGSGNAALEQVATHDVDLLLVDYAMPGMNGAEVSRRAAEIRNGLPVLFITGYADLKALHDVGESRIVRKPFRHDELEQKIRAILGDAATGASENVVPLRKSDREAQRPRN